MIADPLSYPGNLHYTGASITGQSFNQTVACKMICQEALKKEKNDGKIAVFGNFSSLHMKKSPGKKTG